MLSVDKTGGFARLQAEPARDLRVLPHQRGSPKEYQMKNPEAAAHYSTASTGARCSRWG